MAGALSWTLVRTEPPKALWQMCLMSSARTTSMAEWVLVPRSQWSWNTRDWWLIVFCVGEQDAYVSVLAHTQSTEGRLTQASKVNTLAAPCPCQLSERSQSAKDQVKQAQLWLLPDRSHFTTWLSLPSRFHPLVTGLWLLTLIFVFSHWLHCPGFCFSLFLKLLIFRVRTTLRTSQW